MEYYILLCLVKRYSHIHRGTFVIVQLSIIASHSSLIHHPCPGRVCLKSMGTYNTTTGHANVLVYSHVIALHISHYFSNVLVVFVVVYIVHVLNGLGRECNCIIHFLLQ